ncbi:MAG TPA: 2Fe-2S iron-sulfur cluster-binding protein [Thauera sp.]|jgi:ring-1,2-phenylacetyl-CoA epoxidase subunit PaaE|uniref:2Fe-2S iron-sulfur cluster-binding protein n=1 Tax=Thauera sp. TaxID=1905334 RepID=UPI000F9552BC|nr:2Fe-2S iron-sulfur cluster-binding protein [Thauera sp.]MCP5224235.1 2Fe-2S iron-sulfur cluster binding domain-containing protein [Thauera sp.]RTL25754.1 MAG: 2Fe-2S iron-sulfur cluster binding domain-containing protein [Rhodocyclaceae bacterium]HRV78114.1 2Fe-2S iron-sulfur cluster-binding protein [Thauera sp.]
MSAPRFQEVAVKRVSPEAAGAVAITFAIPEAERERFAFEPGQFLTLRATIDGQDVRRNYSISSPRSRLTREGELEIGIRPVEGGLFSNWAARAIKAGDTLQVMPPDGRFVVKKKRAIHRVGFAAGSGITPILSIAATTLEEQPDSKFTLIYGNRRMSTVMFNEDLQDLKDRFRDRLTMIHVLSRQAQEVDLLQGRIDGAKVRAIIDALLPVGSMDEVFICGPDEMITATENALVEAGVPADRIRTERFTTHLPAGAHPVGVSSTAEAAEAATKDITMVLVLDGKEHEIAIGPDEHLLDAGLNAGLDLPFSCKAGVCCTCRAKVTEGEVVMDKNFTLEADEVAQGYVLSCQARATTKRLKISFDER